MKGAGLLTRRQILMGATVFAGVAGLRPSRATPAADAAIKALTKDAPVRQGRVTLAMAPIAENGLSVFTTVSAESPMTETDYVKAIHLFSEKNPIPHIASFYFTPAMAEAKVSTNIRLATSQTVTAIAVMNDGSLWSGAANIVVTIAACIDGG
jgi:sulfur-oxidizing protein SoxY